MRRYKHSKPRGVAPPVELTKYNGFNTAYAMHFLTAPGFVAAVNGLKVNNSNFVLRFPGGTLGNYTHPTSGTGYGLVSGEVASAPPSVQAVLTNDASYADNHLSRMVQLAVDTGAKVVWMANMYTGTSTEAIAAVNAFLTASVDVVGIELGNEWYLNRYAGTYPDHNAYISAAETFRNALKVAHPTIPVGIIIPPSTAMKDGEPGSPSDAEVIAACNAIRALSWPDAYVLHAYAGVDPAITPWDSPAAEAKTLEHRAAVQAHVASFPGKPVWITEWNLFGTAGVNTDTQANHYTAMREYMANEPRITIQTLHNMVGAGVGNNVIRATGSGCTYSRVGLMAAGQGQTPTLVGRTTAAGTASGTATVNVPAGNVGDLLIITLGADAGPTNPAGWNEQLITTYGGDGNTLSTFWRVATGSEGASVSITLSTSTTDWSAIMSRYRGTNSIDLLAASSSSASSSSPLSMSHPGITVPNANSLLVVAAGEDHGVGNTFGSFTPPAGYSHAQEGGNTAYANSIVADKQQATAGATGVVNMSATLTGTSSGYAMHLMALSDAPPPAGSGIAPSDVTIVANSDDPQSAAMASDYATAWGIAPGNIITVALGASHECTTTQATALYNAINTANREVTMLAMRFPSRVNNGQSITSAATFGVRSVNALAVSQLYNYTGTKPFTDTGKRPSAILLSSAYRMDTTTLNDGTSYMVLANDDDRTPARYAQRTTPGIVAKDSAAAGAGPGASACNQLSTDCWISGFLDPLDPVNMAFYSTHHIASDSDAVVWRKGFYGDSVSSYWGYLPTPLDGQTPCTYFLDRGASMSCGTVSEPWQSGGDAPGSLKEQFVDVSIFRPLFVSGVPVGICCWAAIECPDRALVAGDFLFQAQLS